MEERTILMCYPLDQERAGYKQFRDIADVAELLVFEAKMKGDNCDSRRGVPQDRQLLCEFYADVRNGGWSISMSYRPNHTSMELRLTVAGQNTQIWQALERVIETSKICTPQPRVEPCIDDELDGSDEPNLLIPQKYRIRKEQKKDQLHGIEGMYIDHETGGM